MPGLESVEPKGGKIENPDSTDEHIGGVSDENFVESISGDPTQTKEKLTKLSIIVQDSSRSLQERLGAAVDMGAKVVNSGRGGGHPVVELGGKTFTLN